MWRMIDAGCTASLSSLRWQPPISMWQSQQSW
jgi:hypothetical protein